MSSPDDRTFTPDFTPSSSDTHYPSPKLMGMTNLYMPSVSGNAANEFYRTSFPQPPPVPTYQETKPFQTFLSSWTNHPGWMTVGDADLLSYGESDPWSTQPFVDQSFALSPYDSFSPRNEDLTHELSSSNALPLFPFSAQVPVLSPEPFQSRDTTSLSTAEDRNEDAVSSNEASERDDDESNYSRPGSSATRSEPKIKTYRIRQTRSETRGYACKEPGCTKAYVRSEHLKRHANSSHSGAGGYRCIIPGCVKSPCSRFGNLRDHYWTHLEHGGRAGKNEKFTLQELEQILGGKERTLVRKLKDKLDKHKAKEKLRKKQRPQRPKNSGRARM